MADLPPLPDYEAKRGGPEVAALWASLLPFLRDTREVLSGGLSLFDNVAAVVRGLDSPLYVTTAPASSAVERWVALEPYLRNGAEVWPGRTPQVRYMDGWLELDGAVKHADGGGVFPFVQLPDGWAPSVTEQRFANLNGALALLQFNLDDGTANARLVAPVVAASAPADCLIDLSGLRLRAAAAPAEGPGGSGLPLFVAMPERPLLVLVVARTLDSAGRETGAEQLVLPHWQVAPKGGQNGVLLTSLPGLAAGTRFRLAVFAFPE